MKSKELMLNNYVLHSESKEICIVRRIGSNLATVGITGRKIFGHSKEFYPIVLTEEILIKCGFNHKGVGFYIHCGSLIELCRISDKFFVLGFKDVSLCNVYNLHHLQNLYYTLTGKELEIKL